MHEVGNDIPLDPSTALVIPVECVGICFFISGRLDNCGAITAVRETHTEIAVFCDVECVPA